MMVVLMSSTENVLADYLSRAELATQLGKTERTLARWAELRVGPPITNIGRQPRYQIDSVRAWLKAQERPMPRSRRQREVA
jgi:hypothetical protein